ncbi:hypothetical protein JCM10908_004531 [Rhodotorula pacifica]|uniref:uncharacterized protein n=1 Tax=Rhodotorula pacifica TaxID=1495444 RepID=UPI00316EB4AA
MADQGSPLLLSSYARSVDKEGSQGGRKGGTQSSIASHQPATKAAKSRTWPRKHACALFSSLIALLLLLAIVITPIEAPEVLESIYDTAACPACLALLVPLQALARRGDEAFADFAVGFCDQLKIQDEDICAGAVRSQAPILAQVLRTISIGSDAYRLICSSLVGACSPAPLNQITLNFTAPPISALQARDATPSRRIKKEWMSRGRRPFQVAHLSDVHIDHKYAVNSSTDCSKVICCRDYGPESIGPQVEHKAGPCDSPPSLVDSMFRAMDRFTPNISFTVFTGDAVDDAVWDAGRDKVAQDLKLWYGQMKQPSYATFGNHDAAPVNSFPRWGADPRDSAEWLYQVAADGWNASIGAEAATSLAELSGCYSRVHPGTDLKIISINTNFWYRQNFWLYGAESPEWDPNGILTWLTRELDDAEKAQQRVWIVGHIPPGSKDIFVDQSNYANQIYLRYRETIAAHFYGHTHSDTFAIGYSDYMNRSAETASAVGFIGGALTPMSGNPVFRIYDVDPDTYEVMDFRTYTTNVDGPEFQHDPLWIEYYSARQSYSGNPGLTWPDDAPLNATFWHLVTESFERNDTAYQFYNTRLSREGSAWPCDGDCKTGTICYLRTMSSQYNCKQNTTVSQTTRTAAVDQACEGAGLGTMLRAVGDGHLSAFSWSLQSRTTSSESPLHQMHKRAELALRGLDG